MRLEGKGSEPTQGLQRVGWDIGLDMLSVTITTQIKLGNFFLLQIVVALSMRERSIRHEGEHSLLSSLCLQNLVSKSWSLYISPAMGLFCLY